MKPSLDAGSKDFSAASRLNSSQAELRNSMPCSVAVFPADRSSNCVGQLLPGGRAWLSLCLRRLRNGKRHARSLTFRILSTRFLSLPQEWNCLGCFGFDVEKRGTENRTSRAPRTLLLQTRKPEKL